MFRIGSPLITFLTSSASSVSCSTKACASCEQRGKWGVIDEKCETHQMQFMFLGLQESSGPIFARL